MTSRRIEELTAELAEVARLREELVKWQLAFGFIEADEALADCATKLATERAARERAEKEAAQYKLWLEETSKSHDATNAHLERAEQERDAALALSLALSTERYQELCRQSQRAIDAETALASARELLLRFMANTTLHNNEPLWEGLELDIRAWLTSHPAPVAAPRSESRCALSINGQHDWYCKLCMSAPVAAQCSGCAAARELLASIVTYAREDRAETPGVTRLARALVRAEAWLKEHP